MARSQRTSFVILGLLGLSEAEPRSGYEIKKVIDSVIAHFWSESHGQLYPVLKQLADEQLIRSVATKAKGRKKILYAITPKGRTQLRAWLEAPVEVGKPRDELILKLFFGSETEPAVLMRHLEAHRERAQATLAQCREWERQSSAHASPYSPFHLLTIRAGIAYAETNLRWAEESLAALGAMPRRKSRAPTKSP